MERKEEEEEEEELEIKLISGKHIWSFNFWKKLCIYAVGSLSISSSAAESTIQLSKAQTQEQRTQTDLTGDSRPEWNHRMSFLIPSSISVSDMLLHFDLRHHAGLLFRDRTIGDVKIPLSNLIHSSSSTRFVDFEVQSPDGKPNGVLHFSYNLNRSQPKPKPQPQISGNTRPSLYPTVDLWDTTSASEVPREQMYPEVSPAYPMWPPHHPYWAPHEFMHPPPPPPWGYQ